VPDIAHLQCASPAQERSLVAAAKAGTPGAKDALVGAFMPSIAGVARRYRNARAVDHEELMQEGVVGLLRALERFDPARGTPFWAYASWWVRQAMQQLVSELGRPVVMSDRALRQLARVKDARAKHVQAHFSEPSTHDVAEATGLDDRQVERLAAVDRPSRGLEEPLGGESPGVFGDLVADPRAEDAFEEALRHVAVGELHGVPNRLCDRERLVIAARFGLGCEERTLRDIADQLGLSAERVRQIEEEALAELRVAAMSMRVRGRRRSTRAKGPDRRRRAAPTVAAGLARLAADTARAQAPRPAAGTRARRAGS
jgi:RNA polymerase sigma factor (sigma-70 family)